MGLRILILGLIGLVAEPALAREGFYLGIGTGFTSPHGQDVPYQAFELNEFGASVPRMISVQGYKDYSTVLDGGSGAIYRMGFNILGYGAIETIITGHGNHFTDADLREWAAHAHVGARIYPAWHWQGTFPAWARPLEPYVPDPSLDEIGWSTSSSARLGLGLEYFVLSYFKVALDYSYINAPYDNFIFNFQDSDNYPVDPQLAGTTFHEFTVTMNFQFGPAPEADYSKTGMDL
jgi:opacity protein-like surface antigen